ncbi:hypothetical protein TNCV_83801 [Trichonephila clavipes]|nr:hypothetical protein TNCV_83801 [Trichonephila clavipes]
MEFIYVTTIENYLLNDTLKLLNLIIEFNYVRVQYLVRGGFIGYRSRASSKHLSPHLPVDELDSSGVKKGLRCRCKMHVWVSGPQRSRLDVDVRRSDVTALALSYRTFPLRKV